MSCPHSMFHNSKIRTYFNSRLAPPASLHVPNLSTNNVCKVGELNENNQMLHITWMWHISSCLATPHVTNINTS